MCTSAREPVPAWGRPMRSFSVNSSLNALGCRGSEVAPSLFCRRFKKSGRGVDGEGMGCDFKHREVMNGVAKNSIGMSESHADERGSLALIGWHVHDLTGNCSSDNG